MRNYAFEIVYETMEKKGHSDELFHHVLQKNPKLVSEQKNFLKRLSFGTIERCIEMDARLGSVSALAVEKLNPAVRTILRMAMYEICYMEQVPEAVSCNEAVELAKRKGVGKYHSFVNGVLRNAVREKDSFVIKDDWIRFSLPEELMNHFISQYGKKTAKKIAASFLEKDGSVTLHIDENKITAEKYMALLRERGISCQRGFYMEDAVILEKAGDIRLLPGYSEGWFFVQDESSMLPVRCAGIRPGDNVMDICSAPGGKSMHALIQLCGKGMLTARDVSEFKVDKIRENAERLQYENILCQCRDARESDKENEGKMDVVLADVPCSGIGIIGRKPEIKYHAMEQMDSLVELQREICRSAVSMLKPNGTFLYSTCTINQAENEENVRWLEKNFGLHRSSLNEFLPDTLQNKMTEQGMLQMLPGIQKSDGFFVARLIKDN